MSSSFCFITYVILRQNRNLIFVADIVNLLFMEYLPFNILLSQYCHIKFRCNNMVLRTQKNKISSLLLLPQDIYVVKL